MLYNPPPPKLTAFIVLLATLMNQSAWADTDLKAVHLRTEYKINPVTNVVKPRLNW